MDAIDRRHLRSNRRRCGCGAGSGGSPESRCFPEIAATVAHEFYIGAPNIADRVSEYCGSTGVELNALVLTTFSGAEFERCYVGFRSMHPGGVMFALCDGSTRFLDENIARDTLSYLGTRAGGEAV